MLGDHLVTEREHDGDACTRQGALIIDSLHSVLRADTVCNGITPIAGLHNDLGHFRCLKPCTCADAH